MSTIAIVLGTIIVEVLIVLAAAVYFASRP